MSKAKFSETPQKDWVKEHQPEWVYKPRLYGARPLNCQVIWPIAHTNYIHNNMASSTSSYFFMLQSKAIQLFNLTLLSFKWRFGKSILLINRLKSELWKVNACSQSTASWYWSTKVLWYWSMYYWGQKTHETTKLETTGSHFLETTKPRVRYLILFVRVFFWKSC